MRVFFNNASSYFFANGYRIFIPYLLVYVCGWFFGAEVKSIRVIFVLLHFCFFGLFLFFLRSAATKNKKSDWVFWGGLFLVFLVPGAYLEFPADPWEHFRRIFTWESTKFIEQGVFRHQFAYFWGWTTLSWVPFLYRRLALDFYSAVWQFLVCYQIYLFCRRFGLSKQWSYLQVLGFVLLFGHNIFSFRYYALSSTPLAYIAYFGALIAFMDFLELRSKLKSISALVLLVALMALNHTQEILLTIMSVIVMAATFFYLKFPQYRRWFTVGFVLFWILGLIVGLIAFKLYPGIYRPHMLKNFSSFGAFRVFEGGSVYLNTLGIHGLISLCFAVVFFRKYPFIAALTLAPVGVLLYPPAVFIILNNVSRAMDSYRLLYAFPSSIMLVIGLRDVGGLLEKRWGWKQENLALVFAGVLVLLFSLPMNYPGRGRIYFQFYRPLSALALEPVDRVALWIKKNRKYPKNCSLITDSATDFVISTHLGRPIDFRRRRDPSFHPTDLSSMENLNQVIQRDNVCGFLIGDLKLIPRVPKSIIARRSGHWEQGLADPHVLIPQDLMNLDERLLALNWKKTFVPPYYHLYEAP